MSANRSWDRRPGYTVKWRATAGGPLDREGLLKRIFDVTDFNGDQGVDLQEAIFGMVDENSDGVLSKEEFLKFNLELGAAVSDDVFQKQAEQWLALAKAAYAKIPASPTKA